MYLSKIWNLQYGHVQIYAKYAPPKVGWKMVKKLLFLRIVCTQKWRNFQSRFLWSQQCACVDKIFKALLSKYANLRISYKNHKSNVFITFPVVKLTITRNTIKIVSPRSLPLFPTQTLTGDHGIAGWAGTRMTEAEMI